MSHASPIVFIVDDDISVRESLEALIRLRRLATGDIRRSRTGIPLSPTSHCSELPGT